MDRLKSINLASKVANNSDKISIRDRELMARDGLFQPAFYDWDDERAVAMEMKRRIQQLQMSKLQKQQGHCVVCDTVLSLQDASKRIYSCKIHASCKNCYEGEKAVCPFCVCDICNRKDIEVTFLCGCTFHSDCIKTENSLFSIPGIEFCPFCIPTSSENNHFRPTMSHLCRLWRIDGRLLFFGKRQVELLFNVMKLSIQHLTTKGFITLNDIMKALDPRYITLEIFMEQYYFIPEGMNDTMIQSVVEFWGLPFSGYKTLQEYILMNWFPEYLHGYSLLKDKDEVAVAPKSLFRINHQGNIPVVSFPKQPLQRKTRRIVPLESSEDSESSESSASHTDTDDGSDTE